MGTNHDHGESLSLHDILMREILLSVERGDIDEEDISSVAEETIRGILPKLASDLLRSLKRRTPEMLREHRMLRDGFISRNAKRWRNGFNKIEMLIVISQEIGSEMNTELRPAAATAGDAKFEALVSLHARAVLISREILCLMRCGFADGALSRWRTLHEIATVAHFLSEQDASISERYLLHDVTNSFRAAEQYREYQERANLIAFDEGEFEDLRRQRDKIVEEHGNSMLYDWGWAAPVLGKEKPRFFDIERYCGLDHWRPRYKWATRNTHGNYRHHMTSLGMSEAEQEMLLVGESNSGMTDPAQMMAISLVLATNSLMTIDMNLDRCVFGHVLRLLCDEIGETFITEERKSLERYRRKEARSGTRTN